MRGGVAVVQAHGVGGRHDLHHVLRKGKNGDDIKGTDRLSGNIKQLVKPRSVVRHACDRSSSWLNVCVPGSSEQLQATACLQLTACRRFQSTAAIAARPDNCTATNKHTGSQQSQHIADEEAYLQDEEADEGREVQLAEQRRQDAAVDLQVRLRDLRPQRN